MFSRFRTIIIFAIFMVCAISLNAQSTEFTYQGRLLFSDIPANGNYDFEFALFDAATGGNQLGTNFPLSAVLVNNGVFSVRIDFGDQFPGANRYLEIHVKQTGSSTYAILSPRQSISSAPYSIKSLNAANADTAANATQLGGVSAGQFVVTSDTRLSDARLPLPNSANYIQNATSQQASSNFNVSGTGTANIFNAATQYNIGGSRVLSMPGTQNLFGGIGSGQANTTGTFNTYFGTFAGNANTTGVSNSLFGNLAGVSNTTGSFNSFFGDGAGNSNTTANSNSFFGGGSGAKTTSGGSNSFFGTGSGSSNTTGTANAFFGGNGIANTTGFSNTFIGVGAGNGNTTGAANSFFGAGTGTNNITGINNTAIGMLANFGSGDLSFATAIGAGATVSTNNTVVLGRPADGVVIPGGLTVNGNTNLGGTFSANAVNATSQFNIGGTRILWNPGSSNLFAGVNSGNANTTGSANAFFGNLSGQSNTTGGDNSFFGASSGLSNTTGARNSFFGRFSGGLNTTGPGNSFFGWFTGSSNTTGGENSFFGDDAGANNTIGGNNSFFGSAAGSANTTGSVNSFFGNSTGSINTTGSFNAAFGAGAAFNLVSGNSNVFLGNNSGPSVTTGSNNVFLGLSSGQFISAENNNSFLGTQSSGAAGVTNATAVGFRSQVEQSNSLVLGSINGKNGATADTRVGIGTTAPAKHLHVLGAGDQEIAIQSSDSGGRMWTVQSSQGASNGRFEIIDRTANASRLSILDTGSVGIGTTAPSDRLDVNGVMRVESLGSAGSVSLCRNASNEISTCSSSIRYKSNIVSFKPGLDLVRQLRPVSFNWKADGTRDLGLVAEEVNKIDPLLTTINEKGQVEGVKYDRVGVVLVNAVNEQQAEIESLRKLVDLQKTVLDQQEALTQRQQALSKRQQAEIDALKKIVCTRRAAKAVCRPGN